MGVSAIYILLVDRNLIRLLIGLEIFTKAVTLILAVAGYATGKGNLVQACIVTLIEIEVVVITIAAGIVIGTWRHTADVNANTLSTMKG